MKLESFVGFPRGAAEGIGPAFSQDFGSSKPRDPSRVIEFLHVRQNRLPDPKTKLGGQLRQILRALVGSR